MSPLSGLLYSLIQVYTGVIFVYVLLSWFPVNKGILLEINKFLGRLCDPYLNLFRKFIPPIGGMLDVSPIVAILILQLVQTFIVRL